MATGKRELGKAGVEEEWHVTLRVLSSFGGWHHLEGGLVLRVSPF